MRGAVISLSLIGMALLTIQTYQRELPLTDIEIVSLAEADDEQWRINTCILAGGAACFDMKPPNETAEQWPARYLGCNAC